MNYHDYKDPDLFMEQMMSLKHLSSLEIPNIDLYMDQVTTFMDTHLGGSKRHPDDKVLTKTMINNYAKNNLLPSPKKKRYSKDHLLLLIFIYYFKNILSINDIDKVLRPVIEKYFQGEPGHDISYIYDEVFRMEKECQSRLAKDLSDYSKMSSSLFPDADPEDQDFLREFALICLLSYDVYCKKAIIEKMIDSKTGSGSGAPKEKEKK